jgi:hypothetical protein
MKALSQTELGLFKKDCWDSVYFYITEMSYFGSVKRLGDANAV